MGGKTSTTTQQVSIPKEVMDRYNAINKRAEGVAQTPFQIYSTDPSKFVAQITGQQQQGIDAVNQAAGSYAPYFEDAYGSATAGMQSAQPQDLNLDQFYNPYQQQVIDATMRQMTQANEQAQSGALGTAVSSGAFGGDRAGIAAANLANQQGLAMGSTLAGLNAQNYNQALAAAQQQQGVQLGAAQADLARLMQGGQFYAGLGQAAQQAGLQGAEAQINAGTLGQQTEQAGLTALYNQFMQQQAYPFQVAQFLANIGMGTGALSGSTTSTVQPTPFFSDRRLKEDVERIGESDEGLPIYKYRYKGEPETHIGFMADEVEKVHPEAVGVHPTGYKTVDYDRAAKAGGGVAGPYGAMVGSQPGMGSYVPEAYLPVGELMVADSSMMDQSNQSLASMMDSANRFGDSLSGLYDKYGMVKEELNKWREKQREQASATPGTPSRAYGGGVRPAYAYGGDAAYLRTASSGEQPVEKKTYLSDVLDSQSKRDDTIPTAKGDLAAPRSAAQDIADLGKVALSFMGMNRGGVAGYQAGGAPTATDDRELEAGLRAALLNRPTGQYQAPAAGVAPPSEDRVIRLPQQPSQSALTLPEGSPTTIPRESPLAPDVSQRPAPRPAGVAAAAPVAAPAAGALPDGVLMGLAGGAIERAAADGQPQAQPQVGLAPAAVQPEATPRTNTGVAPRGGYAPIIPLETQLNFVLHELQHPAYNDYLKQSYESPAQAAIAFDTIYERSGGQGNDRAAAYAEDVYAAAAAGDLSGLPPNAAAAYTHFVEGGMDPIKAAGATGRLMVESYAHLDPNARNTLGGGYGTYGVAQWRGDRMENLAAFAGVPLEALTGAPVSTPEGRYYASSSGRPEGGLGRANLPSRSGAPQGDANTTFIGGVREFLDQNKSNPDFLLSVLSGLGTMASSPSLYLGSAVLQGIGGAANTYMAREQQRGEITAKNLENAQTFMRQYMAAQEMGYRGTPEQYASEIKYNGPIMGGIEYSPTVGADRISSFNGVPLDPFGRGMSMPLTLEVDGQPVEVMAGQSYGYLKALETKLVRDVAIGMPGAADTLAQVQTALTNHRGEITLPDGTTVQDPSYRAAAFGSGSTAVDVERTGQMRLELPQETRAAQEAARRTNELHKALSMLPSTGNLSGWFSTFGNIGQQLGLNVDTSAAAGYEIASKVIAEEARTAVGELAGSVDTSMLNGMIERSTANPNLTPEAIEELLAIRAGIADYNLALARAKDEALRRDRTANLVEVERQFVRENKPEDFVEQRRDDYTGTIRRPASSISRPEDIPQDAWDVMTDEERVAVTEGN